jgi:hypothetical protein
LVIFKPVDWSSNMCWISIYSLLFKLFFLNVICMVINVTK